MKSIITSVLILLATIVVYGQRQKNEALLTSYYAVKDALVNGDDKSAAESAGDLIKQIEAFKTSDKKVLLIKEKIKTDATKIVTNSLAGQRDGFALVSTNLFELAKLVDLSPTPVYQFYCPMRKATWLSSESTVKNPYYGKQMLTCGSLQETLK